MQVHPAITALRDRTVPQQPPARTILELTAEWRQSEAVLVVTDALQAYSDGGELSQLTALDSLFLEPDLGRAFVDTWCTALLDALAREPLSEVPFRYKFSPGLSRVQLLQQGEAILSLVSYEPVETTNEPTSALFADRDCTELVLTGHAEGMRHRLEAGAGGAARIKTDTCRWNAGEVICVNGINEARQFTRVERSTAVLQLSRSPKRAAPTRELALKDGRLLQIASGDKGASQRLMAVSLLGALGHEGALDVMLAKSLEASEDADVRWEAVRQTLALDAAKGVALLDRLRSNPADTLAEPAAQLRAQLLAAQPELAQLIEEPA